MRRRDFITAIAGSAVAWPFAARAQPAGKVWRIGFLSGSSREIYLPLYRGFQEGMGELGYVEGKDFIGEIRVADGRYERLPDLAAELVSLKVDIIVTALTAGIRTLQQATNTIPSSWLIQPIRSAMASLPAWPGPAATPRDWPARPMKQRQNKSSY